MVWMESRLVSLFKIKFWLAISNDFSLRSGFISSHKIATDYTGVQNDNFNFWACPLFLQSKISFEIKKPDYLI